MRSEVASEHEFALEIACLCRLLIIVFLFFLFFLFWALYSLFSIGYFSSTAVGVLESAHFVLVYI